MASEDRRSRVRGSRCKLQGLLQIFDFHLIGRTSVGMEPSRLADDDHEAPSSCGLPHGQPPLSSANAASVHLGWRLDEVLDARCCASCPDLYSIVALHTDDPRESE